MKGTAILFKEQDVKFIEDIDHSVFQDIQHQCGCKHCNCSLGNKIVDLGTVSPAFWHEDEIDWDYGY